MKELAHAHRGDAVAVSNRELLSGANVVQENLNVSLGLKVDLERRIGWPSAVEVDPLAAATRRQRETGTDDD